MSRRIRGAVVGTGYSAGLQLQAWSEIETVDIVAVAGRSHEKAARRAAEFEIPAAYDDVATMLDAHDLDFVDIATPPGTHAELVGLAVARHLHVICQKPAAESLASMRQMVADARAEGVILGINENCRFQPWFRAIRRRLDAGELGQPYGASLTTRARLSMPVPRFEPQPYFAQMPRLIVFELGVHLLDTVRYLFGNPTSLYAVTRQVSHEIAGEDAAVVLVTFESMSATLDLSWASHPTWSSAQHGWADVRIDGSRGSAHLSTDGRLRVVTDAGETIDGFSGDAIQDGYRAAQADFADAVLTGRQPETSGADQLATMELVFGAYESARTGEIYRVGRDTGRLA